MTGKTLLAILQAMTEEEIGCPVMVSTCCDWNAIDAVDARAGVITIKAGE